MYMYIHAMRMAAWPRLVPTRGDAYLRRMDGGGSGYSGRRTAYQNAPHTDGDGLGRRRGGAPMLRQPIERVADVRGMCGEEGHEAAD